MVKIRSNIFIEVIFFYLAKDKKFDVVLIDTAGRMQNDEPLMIALAKVMNFS
jgi:signal recognition particle GTPase